MDGCGRAREAAAAAEEDAICAAGGVSLPALWRVAFGRVVVRGPRTLRPAWQWPLALLYLICLPARAYADWFDENL
jgi:hypothetical protein